MKFCRFCGAKLDTPMKFCFKCGKSLEPASVPTAQDAEVSFRPTTVQTPSAVIFRPTDDDEEVTFRPAPVEEDEQPQANVPLQPDPVQTYAPPFYGQAAAAEPPKKKSRRPLIIAAAILAVMILGAFAAVMLRDPMAKVNRAASSVLYLECYDHNGEVLWTGSGFLIEDGRTLVTNYHVMDGAYEILAYEPKFEYYVEIHNALTYDETSDLAVLLCDQEIGLPPLTIADSYSVRQGDKVYAVGYPLGLYHTMSDGILSSHYIDGGVDYMQTTAPISHGNSGGALLNEKGQVVGIVCAYLPDGQNLNLAISSNTLTDLIDNGYKQIPLSTLYYK